MAVYNDVDPVEDESHQVISSFFLGPKAENFKFFNKSLLEILDAQCDARHDYFPRDGRFITDDVKSSAAYRKSIRKMGNAVRQAAHLLGKHSIPYCPLTTVAEMVTGEEICKMFGFNTDPDIKDLPVAWGHIVCGGTIANLEPMWVARNLKFYPLSIRSAMKDDGPLAFIANDFKVQPCIGEEKLLVELDKWELLNLKPSTILDIPDRLYKEYHISPAFVQSVMDVYGIQSVGKSTYEREYDLGDMLYFCSNTKHYSWPKAGAVTGIGSDHVIGVKVDHGARVEFADLRSKLQKSLDEKVPVYAVVAIIGSTEEGSVDPLAGIIKMRSEFQSKGLSFLVHGDAAWGGYFCTMLPYNYKPGDPYKLPSEKGSGSGFVPDASLRADTQEDLFMLREADSVTVDPHKAAYVPYPAGGLRYRDGRMRYLVTWTSPVLSRGNEGSATNMGIYGIEGSKPGASVMSTWFSNRCIGLGPDGYGKLLGEVTFTCSRLAAEWAAMSEQKDHFAVVPLNELPSELKKDSTPEKVEKEKQRIRDQILKRTNEQLVAEDESRPEDDKTLALLRALGSDLNINAFSTNWKYADGTLNTEVEEANYFNTRVIQRLSIDSPEDDPTEIPFFLTSTTFKVDEYGECVQHFKKRLGLHTDEEDLIVMRNVVMSPWPTDGNFLGRLVHEFRVVLDEEAKICRERNDVSPTKHEFLMQGTDQVYILHFPMFHLEKHRHQLIIQIGLPDDVHKTYSEAKTKDSQRTFVLTTTENLDLASLVSQQKRFKASIGKRGPDGIDPLVSEVEVQTRHVVKDKSLKGRFRDTAYPSKFPFYLYGTEKSLNIDHVLVNSPNIQLSAENITLQDITIDPEVLAKGAILFIDNLSERAMQPFQSTEGPMGDTLGENSTFFFRSGQEFKVSIYKDPKDWNEPGPGLLKVSADGLIGKGIMKFPPKMGRYIDSVLINKDPFEVPEGTEKFKAWKKVFDNIGKELD